jgi:2-deoxy-D-gluconate 3-dehydrogenase
MRELFGLEGKRALVVGGGRGMGESTARLLAEAGCDVAVLDVERDRAEHVAEAVRGYGRRGEAIVANVLDDEQAAAAVAEADRLLGGLDVLVTIVGQALFTPLLAMTGEQWDSEQRRNLRYFFVVGREAARIMIRNGSKGAMCCIASVDGVQSAPIHGAYGAAKAGLIHLVKTMATEWAEHGIRVNAVAPGNISTPRLPETPETREVMKQSLVPMARSGVTDEIGKPVLFLVSDMASYITGHTILVDGGWMAANLFDARRFGVKPTTERPASN